KHGIGDVVHGVGHAASWAMHKAGETVGGVAHKGLEWLHKTGVAGAIGKGLKYGVSMIKTAAKYSPIGLAMQGIHKAGGLKGIWDKTKHMAGAAWGGIQKAYHATSSFLQSPAGQLLVTGLSLAASFIPGGMIVKGLRSEERRVGKEEVTRGRGIVEVKKREG